jgi:hypothetical protein
MWHDLFLMLREVEAVTASKGKTQQPPRSDFSVVVRVGTENGLALASSEDEARGKK